MNESHKKVAGPSGKRPDAMNTPSSGNGHNKIASGPLLHEDWATVILGLAIIAVFLTGWVIPPPTFGWGSWEDIGERVLSRSNAGFIVLQFLFVYVTAAVAA